MACTMVAIGIETLRLLFMGCSDVRPRGRYALEFIFVWMMVLPSSGESKFWGYRTSKDTFVLLHCIAFLHFNVVI